MQAEPSESSEAQPVSTHPTRLAGRGAAATGHPAVTNIAVGVLESGGTAADAAVAALWAACVAEPVLCSPAGGLIASIRSRENHWPQLLDAFVQTPRIPRPDSAPFPMAADFGSTRQVFHLGAASVATPGFIAGVYALHEHMGRIPMRELVQPACELARQGVLITAAAEHLFRVVGDLYRALEDTRVLFAHPERPESGELVREGCRWRNPDLADVMESIAAEGPALFYRGEIAQQICALNLDRGGHLSREDFESYQCNWNAPRAVPVDQATVFVPQSPSIGGLLMGVGLDHFLVEHEPATLAWGSVKHLRSLARCSATMSAIRTSSLDNLTGDAPPDWRSENLRLQQAFRDVSEGLITRQGTTHLSVMDRFGNAVSVTTSNGAGSGIVPKRLGFVLNNMLGEADLLRDHDPAWLPNRRMLSMMTPCLAHLGDDQWLAAGSGGSNRIRSVLLGLMLSRFHFSMSLLESVIAPRLHVENGEIHVEAPMLEWAEAAFPEEVKAGLLVKHDLPNLFFGGAHCVEGSPRHGYQAIGDPRRGGTGVSLS